MEKEIKFKIRQAKKDDAKQLLDIYRPYVENTAVTCDCTLPSVNEFENKITSISQKYPFLVAELNGQILGYVYAKELYNREAFRFSAEISIYVSQNYRKNSIGKNLYKEIEKELIDRNISNVYASVVYSGFSDKYINNDSFIFHQHLGYKKVGHFTNCIYKFGKWYDMVWMEKILK